MSHRYQSGVSAARAFLVDEFGSDRSSKPKRKSASKASVSGSV
jgi:hypothetical protein